MDTARQIVRWSIPGWCFIIFVFLFIGLGSAFVALWSSAITQLGIMQVVSIFPSTFLNPTLGILLGFAGIPIGYLIYQMYFWRYWRGVTTPFGLIVSADKGSQVLNGIVLTPQESASGFCLDLLYVPESKPWSFERVAPRFLHFLGVFAPSFVYIPNGQLKDNDGTRLNSFQIAQRLGHNWAVALTMWYRFAVIPSDYVNRQVSYMFDIYHSQGAVATAVLVAFVLSLTYELTAQLQDFLNVAVPLSIFGVYISSVVAVLLWNTLLFLVLFKLLSATRRTVLSETLYLMNRTVAPH